MNATAICGNAGEMVMTDIMVKLLTSNSVSFSFQLLFSMFCDLVAFVINEQVKIGHYPWPPNW